VCSDTCYSCCLLGVLQDGIYNNLYLVKSSIQFEHVNVLYINIFAFFSSFAQRGFVDLHSCNIYNIFTISMFLLLSSGI